MNMESELKIKKNHSPIIRAIVGLMIAVALSSCQFNAPYDDKTDKAISELVETTEKFVARCDVERLPYSKAGTFYTDATGSIRSIKSRSDLYLKNEREVKALDRLEAKFNNLRLSHKEGPITSSLADPIRVSFRSLQQMQIAKKRSLAFSQSLKAE